MKKNKILTSLALALSMIVVSGTTVFATDSSIAPTISNSVFNENLSGTASLNDSTSIVSEALTFDEIVSEIAKDNNISEEEAALQVESSFQTSPDGTSRISRAQAALEARASTYHTISSTVTVTSTYKPTVKFYCLTDTWPGSSFRAIEKILNISLDRSYNGTSKGFGGTIYANLETSNSIYWIVEGDYYNNSSSTGSGSVNIGLGGGSSITLSATSQSNHYKYSYQKGYARF